MISSDRLLVTLDHHRIFSRLRVVPANTANGLIVGHQTTGKLRHQVLDHTFIATGEAKYLGVNRTDISELVQQVEQYQLHAVGLNSTPGLRLGYS